MYNEDDLLPISALQHWLFCPRQCALIHLEQAWSENQLTAQGRVLHDRAHNAPSESRGDLRVIRGLRLCSRELGLTGQADVVELHLPQPDTPLEQQANIPGLVGRWIIQPVEYKRGRPKQADCDRVQLCAQAMCLEEMLQVGIVEGTLFYGQPHRRETVVLDNPLRQLTCQTAVQIHQMIRGSQTPSGEYSPQCRSCSLIDTCMPKYADKTKDARIYLRRQLNLSLAIDAVGERNSENP